MDETTCARRAHWKLWGLAAGLVLAISPPARAGDSLGAYVGAAFGEGWVKAADRTFSSPVAFNEKHSAYKLMAGVRPISLVGAEIEYVDFGHPHEALRNSGFLAASADVGMKGAAAFGTLYLPVPVIDLYLKAGLSRIRTSANVAGSLPVALCPVGLPDCGHFSRHNSVTDTHFAAGAGLQLKLGSWAVRAEYERFDAAGANPGLATFGVTWTFL